MDGTVLYAKSVDPNLTPRVVATDLGLYCLPRSHLWDARNKCVKFWLVDRRLVWHFTVQNATYKIIKM